MLTTVKGVYEGGKIILLEDAPVKAKADVFVTFFPPDAEAPSPKKRGAPGGLQGKVDIPEDFNEPLDDLKDYM